MPATNAKLRARSSPSAPDPALESEAPVESTPAPASNAAPHDETPHDETPHDETPHDETPHDETPQDDPVPHANAAPAPKFATKTDPLAQVYVGDCRKVLTRLMPSIESKVDLVFADPPFNWNRAYDKWHDSMPDAEYLQFTYDWLDLCAQSLRPGGSMWVNIPDDWAAEIVVHMKSRGFAMVNWCIWHYRFGQNLTERFINSKVHALYFLKPESATQKRTWNADEVLEMSDRAAIYGDPRTQSKKDGMPPGMRVPMDVWYGKFWGRIQGNNKERREQHDNQLPELYLERVVRSTSNAGDLVLDPFLGSGTTGVVAHHLGRRFIGAEFSIDNARRAFARIKMGPVRELGTQRGTSTAIFPKRAGFKGPKSIPSPDPSANPSPDPSPDPSPEDE